MKRADLSPPLGDPGGPCFVVRRIVKQVPDLRLRNKLVDDVEAGIDLQNSAAAKIYPLKQEPGVGVFDSLLLTAHVQYRLDLRGITIPEVEDVLLDFSRQLLAWKKLGNPAYERILRNPEILWVKDGLKLVFTTNGKTAKLVTAYRPRQGSPAPVKCRVTASNVAFWRACVASVINTKRATSALSALAGVSALFW